MENSELIQILLSPLLCILTFSLLSLAVPEDISALIATFVYVLTRSRQANGFSSTARELLNGKPLWLIFPTFSFLAKLYIFSYLLTENNFAGLLLIPLIGFIPTAISGITDKPKSALPLTVFIALLSASILTLRAEYMFILLSVLMFTLIFSILSSARVETGRFLSEISEIISGLMIISFWRLS